MIGYVGKAFVINNTSGLTAAVPMPSTAAAGDKLYVITGSIGSNAGEVTVPAGWSKAFELSTGGSLRALLCTKTAAPGDAGTTVTWTYPSSGRTFGLSVAYSGVDVDASDLVSATGVNELESGPWPTPSLSLSAGDWLLTAAVGRENPGTATAKSWANADTSDVERFDVSSTAEPSINISAALWDSNRALAAGTAARTITASLPFTNSQVWAARIPAPVGAAPGGGNPWTVLGFPMR
jgi:hypothetical protein